VFFAIFGCGAHLRMKCAEIAIDWPGQPAYGIFSTERRPTF